MKRVRFALICSLACCAALVALPAGALAQAGRPSANIWSPSYNVRLDVQPDGSLDVVETITLSVGAKTMSWFERAIPTKRTDGLTNVVALMNGQAVPVSIEQGRDLKIRWDFSPVANATHTFEIRYRAVHVLAREIDGPRLMWTALPRRHTYPIEAAEISVFAPAGSMATSITATGGNVLPATEQNPGVVIAGKSLAKDRAMAVDITFAPNSIKPVEPKWFIEQQRQREMLPAWLAAAASLLAVGLGILVMMFARLPRPKAPEDGAFVSPASEGAVPPALVALLIARGQQHVGMQSAFFRLVRDGHLLVAKRGERSRWRTQSFDVTLNPAAPGGAAVAPHESWILDAVREDGGTSDMRKLMTRLSRRQHAFRKRLIDEATSRGWIDAERMRARGGLFLTGLVLVVFGVVASIAVLVLASGLGPAPVALPGVIFLMGLVYVVVASAMSMLSGSGVNEGARWQARVAELKAIIKGGVSGHSPKDFERWFPLAIGAGIGGQWLKVFEPQLTGSGAELGWLRAMGSPADAAASLAMMVAVTGASHSGGAGGAGGGAGGGSSSAG